MIATVRAPRQLIFGSGTLSVLPTLCSQNGSRLLIVTDKVLLQQPLVANALEAVQEAVCTTAVFADTSAEVPLADVAAARAAARDMDADSFLAVGGGSVIDLAKIVNVLHSHGGEPADYYGEAKVPGPVLPLVAAPTTSGTGTEVSPVSVMSDPELRMKIGVSSVYLIPDSAVVDPELTLSCPATVTAHSGIDAFCHAVESYLAPPRPLAVTDLIGSVFLGQNPVTDNLALRAVAVIGRSLRRAVADGSDAEARQQMALGSVSAGLSFSHAGTGCPHALQYPIGAATGTPHGLGVGLLLPYVLAAARTAAAGETQRRLTTLAECVGLKASPAMTDPAAAFVDWVVALLADIGLPSRLADIGVQRSDLPGIAEQAQSLTRLLRNHPGPTDSSALLAILDAAWLGDLA